MQFVLFNILLLALSEPLLINAKKVVLMIPREIRRSPGIPRRQGGAHLLKYGKNEVHHHGSNHPYFYRSRKPPPFSSGPPFPHGGDDFDQGHESVNHVNIPYGEGVRHAITFGKGYIPYENLKSDFPAEQDKYLALLGRKQKEAEYSGNFAGDELAASTSYRIPQGSYSHESTGMENDELNERRNDYNKYYAERSIGNELVGKVEAHSSNSAALGEKGPQLKGEGREGERPMMEGAIVLPAGIPSTTIGGSKEGIVLRDTVALDDYKKTVDEMTKSWPSSLGISPTFDPTHRPYQPPFSPASYPTSGWRGSAWDYAQSKQGYDVKEDVAESPPDFRTMPIQTSPFQAISHASPLQGFNFPRAVHG